jgi:hypothetical protein
MSTQAHVPKVAVDDIERVSIGHSQAIAWVTKLRQQLDLIGAYSNVEDVPSSITIDESILDAPRRRAADPSAAIWQST